MVETAIRFDELMLDEHGEGYDAEEVLTFKRAKHEPLQWPTGPVLPIKDPGNVILPFVEKSMCAIEEVQGEEEDGGGQEVRQAASLTVG